MKKIECFIRPEKIIPVKKALSEMGIMGMSIYEVKGHGNQGGIWLTNRSGRYCVEWIDKMKLEMIVSNNVDIKKVIDIIAENAHTGKEGDGKIFISPVEQAIRIRTREEGEQIL